MGNVTQLIGADASSGFEVLDVAKFNPIIDVESKDTKPTFGLVVLGPYTLIP